MVPPSVMKLQCLSCICRRRLKCEITSIYCTLTREQVDSLIPDAKLGLVTYGGVVMMMYHVNLEPMLNMGRSLFLEVREDICRCCVQLVM